MSDGAPSTWPTTNIDTSARPVPFLDDRATRVQAVTEYGRGDWLMVPLRMHDGDLVLVNRGFVSASEATSRLPGGVRMRRSS